MRLLPALLMVVLPSSLRRLVARRVLGWDIHPTAYIGRSVILVGHVSMGPRATIGQRNVIRALDELRLGEGASIATRNWIVGIPHLLDSEFPTSPNRTPALILGKGALISDAHEIDCADRVELADYASLAGFRSQILTHSLNLVKDRFEAKPVEIGEHSIVMSGSILQSGTRVPNRCIVSAGSVVTTRLTKELTMYRGNPAEAVRELPADLGYFQRGESGPDAVAEAQAALRQ
jgi:carbonic anhydrase/acetyltransferase-like protein (isoleucine patch superfamily)